MNSENKHIGWVDVVRALATLMVLLNHAVDETYVWRVDIMKDFSMLSRSFAFTVFSIGRMGVPIFLMISGYLLLDRDWNKERCIKFWKKNWLRLLICTELWWIFYEFYLKVYFKVPLVAGQIVKHLLFLDRLPLPHVWYMTEILGIYILIPFVGIAVNYFELELLKFPIIIFSIYAFVTPIINACLLACNKDGLDVQFSLGFTGGAYGLYIIWGYLIKKGIFKKIKSICFIIIPVISVIIMVALQIRIQSNEILYTFWYNNGFVCISAISVMELISRIKELPGWLMSILKSISKHSFGIYLVHELILQPFRSIISHDVFSNITCTILSYIVTVILSWGIVATMSRIPRIGKLLFNER